MKTVYPPTNTVCGGYKNREIHLLVIKENWLSGAAVRARQARRGHGFHIGPSLTLCFQQ